MRRGARWASPVGVRVSVIIPVHNRAALAREAVVSALGQTRPPHDVIVVDDGSTDDLAGTVRDLERVTYVRSDERRGSGAARTLGLARAGGEIIASLDSDDLWEPRFLEEAVGALEAHGLDFAWANWVPHGGGPSDFERLLERGWGRRFARRREGGWWLLEPAEVRSMLLESCPAPSSAVVMRRSAMPAAWNTSVRIADDWYLLLEMALARPCRAAFTLTPLWHKRRDGANKYDGREAVDIWRELNLHDGACFRRDFAPLLTRPERARLAGRAARHRAEHAYLRARRMLRDRLRPAASQAG